MLKKNEVIEILKNDGHIYMNEIYRTASVYNAAGERVDTCRYDTAQKIAKQEYFKETQDRDAWSFSKYVRYDWDAVSAHVADTMTDALKAFEDAGVISDLKVEPIKAAPEKQPQTRRNYVATIQDRYSCETRETKLEALNEKHARLIAGSRCDVCEYVAAIEEEPTGQAKTDRENREHCKRIAEDLEDYASGNVYRCPDCGEILTLPDDVGDKYRCPDCGTVNDVDDLEQQSLYDYFEDCLDIEFRVSGRDRDALRSVQIMVAYGGPNIYIDTATKQVELYWWTDRASYPISYDACNEVDAWASEYWGCM